MTATRALVLLFTLSGLLFSGCSQKQIKEGLKKQQPKVTLEQTRITGMSLDYVDLGFDLKIDNPNPVAITLAGFSYDLSLDGRPFLKGRNDERSSLKAMDSSQMTVPLRLDMQDLYDTYQGLKDQDETTYKLLLDLDLEVPVLGVIPYQVKVSKSITLPKAPKLSLQSINTKKLGLSGADLELLVEVDNPNSFAFDVQELDYQLDVAGSSWASGKASKLGGVKSKQKGVLKLPISLDFRKLGSGIYQALISGKPLDYHFKGNVEALSDHPLLGSFKLPYDNSGQVNPGR